MFTAFIAVALELLALAVGAKVLLACCRDCCKDCCRDKSANPMTRTAETNVSTVHKEHCKGKHHNCHGFLKAIGYFTIVMSVVAFVCTCVALSCFLTDAIRLEKESNGPVEQYNHNLDRLRKYGASYGLVPRVVEEHVNRDRGKLLN